MPAKKIEGVDREPNGRRSRATGKPAGGSKPRGAVALAGRLQVRVGPDQLAAVEAAAAAAGVSPAEWVRRAVEVALKRADHARQIAAHLEAVGGMPGATD